MIKYKNFHQQLSALKMIDENYRNGYQIRWKLKFSERINIGKTKRRLDDRISEHFNTLI